MSGEHAEITLDAGNVDLIDFAGEGELFRRDEIEVEGGHGSYSCEVVEWRIASGDSQESGVYLFATPNSRFAPLSRFGGELLALFDRLFDGADHVEGGFRQVIVLAFADGRGSP